MEKGKAMKKILKIVNTLLDLGVKLCGDPEEIKKIRITNRIAFLLMGTNLANFFAFAAMGEALLYSAHLAVVVGSGISIILIQKGYRTSGKSVLLASAYSMLIIKSISLGKESGIVFFFIPLFMAPFILFRSEKRAAILIWLSIGASGIIALFAVWPTLKQLMPLTPEQLRTYWYIHFFGVTLISFLFVFYLIKEHTIAIHHAQTLKAQQDGDYYLTSLLSQPLSRNENNSPKIKTETFIAQKKNIHYKKFSAQIGGDICITGNVRFFGESHVFFANGDAMGKSLQGAGGAIAFGAYVNAIIRSGPGDVMDVPTSPEKWLSSTLRKLDSVFESFDGSMAISSVMGLINERTLEMTYFNAEHPAPVLLRKDQDACFLVPDSDMHKIGFRFGQKVILRRAQLIPGDIILIGSDGRDDVRLRSNGEVNHDENLFRRIAGQYRGDVQMIFDELNHIGDVSDDFSIIRLEVLPVAPEARRLSVPAELNQRIQTLQGAIS